MASAQQIAPGSWLVKIGVFWQRDSADELLKIYENVLGGPASFRPLFNSRAFTGLHSERAH